MTDLQYLLTTPITYVEIALVLFLSVFISVLLREALRNKPEIMRLSSLPLEQDGPLETQE